MNDCFVTADTPETPAIPLLPLEAEGLTVWLEGQPQRVRQWVAAAGFKARPEQVLTVPDEEGGIGQVLVGASPEGDTWSLAAAAGQLQEGVFAPPRDWPESRLLQAAVGWGLSGYRFDRYRRCDRPVPQLHLPGLAPKGIVRLRDAVAAVSLVRDLINTPAEDMMPEHLGAATEALAEAYGARVSQVVGEDLLRENYPAIHRVGRASAHAPRLIDLEWGDPAHPRITLVGKGVCFDSGGLDIKSADGMRWMKKDMGGAAHVLGLARLVMAAGLPVHLRVLIGAVENAISGDAFRPGDVLPTRAGLRVEVDNTDAEGRLVLADLLARAGEEAPEVILDFATLTGAARVAVGTEIAAFFTGDPDLAHGLYRAAAAVDDPCWRLPLHTPYDALLESSVADVCNGAHSPYGGAITAGLFLQRFVPAGPRWVHFDVMAWNTRHRPGRPKGGEAMGLRAAFQWLEDSYRR
ncbi:leucyl aminopeptidase [Ectothiorhodospira mobilis]|uniref:Leucyl aminopeptidase n=1 Tax=Ectothiorhodospira mobilis TaxID=195064 RepID=A0A1I4PUC2_ECTMO|nr:leucyl aminopeptidase family protein [Ectothiorhodospira mobilis]SFM31156.1 leucyl aminopeptidase [Ectothiorhodospira mobilis]